MGVVFLSFQNQQLDAKVPEDSDMRGQVWTVRPKDTVLIMRKPLT